VGILVPSDFPLSLLGNREERLVVEALRDGLTDGWLIFPDVRLTGYRDWQMDIVLAHEHEGVAVIEVKGHRVSVRNGLWCSDGRPLEPQPLDQSKGNAYELRTRLRGCSPALANVHVEYGVAFPNALEVSGDLPPDVDRSQVITGTDLEHVRDAVDRLMHRRWSQNIGREAIESIAKLLRPDAELTWDPEAHARIARRRLETICGEQTRALEPLDANRKVVVTGRAGSGKTRLAMGWVRRAFARGERVMLVCYNDPLGASTRDQFPEDERLVIGGFFDVALTLGGMPELTVPADAGQHFWDNIAIGHLHSHWHEVTQRFDTIVIDEAQDFSPAWIAQLGQLLDPAGPRRLMMVADEGQSVYHRGFTTPSVDDGWTRCELVNNCRNTYSIASMLHRCLGGAGVPIGGPETLGLGYVEADHADAVTELVGEEIDRIVDFEGHEPPRVLVATFSTSLRDRLREDLALVAWEGREPRAIVCENVHRVKGLEFDYVILAATAADTVTDALLYVGVSRAVAGLTVIGPRDIADRLGLE